MSEGKMDQNIKFRLDATDSVGPIGSIIVREIEPGRYFVLESVLNGEEMVLSRSFDPEAPDSFDTEEEAVQAAIEVFGDRCGQIEDSLKCYPS